MDVGKKKSNQVKAHHEVLNLKLNKNSDLKDISMFKSEESEEAALKTYLAASSGTLDIDNNKS